MIRICWFCLMILLFAATGCNNTGDKKIQQSEGLFLDYRAWGDEETGMVTVRLQYLWGGPEGDAIALRPPAKVEWDGQVLQADSSGMTGLYYEVELPYENFGDHIVKFTDQSGETYETRIDFVEMKLKQEWPEIVEKREMTIELEGLKSRQDIQVVLTDTSFYGRGVDRVFVAKKGIITIPRSYMARLSRGPITMEIIYEDQQPIEPAPLGGGELYKTYTIKREFQLVDSLKRKN